MSGPQWTHVIQSLTSDDLETTVDGNEDSSNGAPIGSPRTDLVTFDPEVGKYWISISIYCKAQGADTTPKVRPYFYDQKQTEIAALLEIDPPDFWGKGDLIFRADKNGDAIPTTDGSTDKYYLAPIYIGDRSAKFALEACEDGADLVIVIERVSIEQLPTY